MSWFESHQSLGDHPKTIRAAHTLKISTPQLVGHLSYLWWWALDYAQDGSLFTFSAIEIAHAARWKKNPEALLFAVVLDPALMTRPCIGGKPPRGGVPFGHTSGL